MAPDLGAEAVSQLVWIKWLLAAVAMLLVYLVVLFGRIASGTRNAFAPIVKNMEYQTFQRYAETLLMQGAYDQALNAAEMRIKAFPNDVWCRWLLGQVLYHKGALLESRRAFQWVLEFDPLWEGRASEWLERIEGKLRETTPQLVQ